MNPLIAVVGATGTGKSKVMAPSTATGYRAGYLIHDPGPGGDHLIEVTMGASIIPV
jgi:dephospho-CoA kinase